MLEATDDLLTPLTEVRRMDDGEIIPSDMMDEHEVETEEVMTESGDTSPPIIVHEITKYDVVGEGSEEMVDCNIMDIPICFITTV